MGVAGRLVERDVGGGAGHAEEQELVFEHCCWATQHRMISRAWIVSKSVLLKPPADVGES